MLLLDLRPSCGHPAGHLSPPCSVPGHVHLRVPGWGAPLHVHVLSPLFLSTSRTAVTCFTPQREGCTGAGSLSNSGLSPSNQNTTWHIDVWSLTVSVIKYTCQALAWSWGPHGDRVTVPRGDIARQ